MAIQSDGVSQFVAAYADTPLSGTDCRSDCMVFQIRNRIRLGIGEGLAIPLSSRPPRNFKILVLRPNNKVISYASIHTAPHEKPLPSVFRNRRDTSRDFGIIPLYSCAL